MERAATSTRSTPTTRRPSSTTAAPSTVDELRAWHRDDKATWAGTAFSVIECVGSEDAVALLWRATSTQVGPSGPFPSTGRRVEWVGAHFFRVEGDRIVSLRSVSDRFGKAIQLGAHLAPPEDAGERRRSRLRPAPREGVATPTGLEPAASAVTGRRANQLRYGARLLPTYRP